MSNHNINFDKYSNLVQRIVEDSQELANSLHHQWISTIHLSTIIEGFIETDRLNAKWNLKNARLIPLDLTEAFTKHYEDQFHLTFRRIMFAKMPLVPPSEQAKFDCFLRRIFSFAEDKAKVNVRVLINELLLFERGRKIEAMKRAKMRRE